jgi:hypothetical protein
LVLLRDLGADIDADIDAESQASIPGKQVSLEISKIASCNSCSKRHLKTTVFLSHEPPVPILPLESRAYIQPGQQMLAPSRIGTQHWRKEEV